MTQLGTHVSFRRAGTAGWRKSDAVRDDQACDLTVDTGQAAFLIAVCTSPSRSPSWRKIGTQRANSPAASSDRP
jgi:hypothetical protein